jgi:hypothetical protein
MVRCVPGIGVQALIRCPPQRQATRVVPDAHPPKLAAGRLSQFYLQLDDGVSFGSGAVLPPNLRNMEQYLMEGPLSRRP